MFAITPSVAADTGVHIGDGSLYIRQDGTNTNYSYRITGNAAEDQLYLFGHVIPTVEAAYGIHKFGVSLPPEATWISVGYQNKAMALFKHKILGLPNGRKTNLSIPQVIVDNPHLMKTCIREVLATDGVLGFYNASGNQLHKYARIQIKMTAKHVIEQISEFLHENLGIQASCRLSGDAVESKRHARYILQINRSHEIEVWRQEIGFSNLSHISRMMVFEELGECPAGTTILNRLSYLTGCSDSLKATEPLPRSAFESVISKMRSKFGIDIDADQTIERIRSVNIRINHLARELPRIVDLT